MRHPDARLLVFAKAPHPGEVKTRLIPRLGAAGAADLHATLVRHTLATVDRAALCPVELWCAPSVTDPFFLRCRKDHPLTLHLQNGGNLGMRMQRAFETVLARTAYAVLIGTDCPALDADDLAQALDALRAGCDAVLGPAADGGYVLIGLRRNSPALFRDIAWGTDTVLATTRARLRQLGWTWHEIRTHRDIDEPKDLDHLPASITLVKPEPPR